MIYLSIFFLLFYIINGIYYLIGIHLTLRNHREVYADNNDPLVSIILAARNEAESIGRCLDCLLLQDYPSESYEIIAVNDASTDETLSIIREYEKLHSRIITVDILPQEHENKGKNHAIDKGIKISKGEIIITTDADVTMGRVWLKRIVHAFDEQTGVIVGLVRYEISSQPVHLYQALDSGCMNVLSAALATMNYPITCFGANLAFRRSAYFDVRERVLWISENKGNHEWQMQEIDITTDWTVKPYVHPDSFVSIYPPDTWKEFFNQRARWASTGKEYSKLSVRIYLTFVFCSLLSFIIAIFVLEPKYVLLVWSLKLFIDIPVAISVIQVMAQPKLIFSFPFVYFLQPFIVVITTLLGSLKFYKWK